MREGEWEGEERGTAESPRDNRFKRVPWLARVTFGKVLTHTPFKQLKSKPGIGERHGVVEEGEARGDGEGENGGEINPAQSVTRK